MSSSEEFPVMKQSRKIQTMKIILIKLKQTRTEKNVKTDAKVLEIIIIIYRINSKLPSQT